MKLSELSEMCSVLSVPTSPDELQKILDHLKEQGYNMSNFYQELEMSSRYVDTYQDASFSNAMQQLHSHTFYEILYCLNTCGAEYLIDSNRYRLQEGDIIMIPPGVSHRSLLPEHMTHPYKRCVLWISMDFVCHLTQFFPHAQPYEPTGSFLLRTSGTKWEFLGNLFLRGVREAEQQKMDWDLVVLSNTVHLLVELRRAIAEQTIAPLKVEKPDLLVQIMAYVEKNLSNKITLADTARHFSVSKSTITHTFNAKMGTSFYRCVTQRRLIAAKTLILGGESLEEISIKVGFSDYSAFYRAFKQEYGISPTQYRRMHTNRNESF